MIGRALFAGAVGMAMVAGCASQDQCVTATNPRAIVNGILLRPKEPISTKHVLCATVHYQDAGRSKSFDILMGPYPYSGPIISDAVGWYDNPTPRFYVQSGWIVVAGDWPLAETELVDAAARGCTMIVQIDGITHRVFLLSKTGKEEATVTRKNVVGKQQKWTATEDMYVETSPLFGDITPPAKLAAAPTPIKDFVAYVKARASEAGIREADPLP